MFNIKKKPEDIRVVLEHNGIDKAHIDQIMENIDHIWNQACDSVYAHDRKELRRRADKATLIAEYIAGWALEEAHLG